LNPIICFVRWTGRDGRVTSPAGLADSLNPRGQKAQIFDLNVLGFQSHRDHFAIAFQRSEIEARARDTIGTALSDNELAEKYGLKDNRDWKIGDARKALRANEHWQRSVIRCAYRPFDSPYCFFGPEFMDYPRRELLDHVSGRDNMSLVVSRQIGTAHWRHAFTANGPANDCLISDESSEANQVFPLWRFDDQDNRLENLSPDFRVFLDSRYESTTPPKKSSATSMPSCTRQPTARVKRRISAHRLSARAVPGLGGGFRNVLGPRLGAGAGSPVARVAAAKIGPARVITRSRPCSIRPGNRRSRSTRASSSSRCHKPCRIYTSAAIRCSTNI
jgi:hypothetical protein